MFARGIGPLELVIILVILLLLFGPGRISKLVNELGQTIKGLRKSVKDDSDNPADNPPRDIEP